MRSTIPTLLLALVLVGPATAGDDPVFQILAPADPAAPDASPQPDCTDRGEIRDGDQRITYGLTEKQCCPARGLSTPVCVWGADGQVQHRLLVHACWHSFGKDTLCSPMGLLPADRDVLWIYEGDCESIAEPDVPCRVHLQELTGEKRSKSVVLEGVGDPDEGCPGHDTIELDLTTATFDDPKITAKRKQGGP